jgi:hypothetical protein
MCCRLWPSGTSCIPRSSGCGGHCKSRAAVLRSRLLCARMLPRILVTSYARRGAPGFPPSLFFRHSSFFHTHAGHLSRPLGILAVGFGKAETRSTNSCTRNLPRSSSTRLGRDERLGKAQTLEKIMGNRDAQFRGAADVETRELFHPAKERSYYRWNSALNF